MSPDGSQCTMCGNVLTITLRAHYRKVHQQECTVQFKGEDGREVVVRAKDGLWYCPRCRTPFRGAAVGLQRHARLDGCANEIQDDANMEVREEEDGGEDEEEDDGEESDEDEQTTLEEPDGDEGPESSFRREANVQADLPPVVVDKSPNDDDVEMKVESCAPPDIEIIDLTRDTPMPDSHFIEPPRESPPVKRGSHPLPKQRAHPYARADSGSSAAVKQEWFAPDNVDHKPPRWAQPHSPSQQRRHVAFAIPKSEPGPSSLPSLRNLTINAAPSASASVSPPATSASSTAASSSLIEHSFSAPSVPPALRAFLESIGEPPEELAPIFIRHGFVTERRIDVLAEVPPEGHWEVLKQEIIGQSDLARWLVIEAGLEERVRTRSLRRRT